MCFKSNIKDWNLRDEFEILFVQSLSLTNGKLSKKRIYSGLAGGGIAGDSGEFSLGGYSSGMI
jgi:hypothetical protein